MNEPRQLKHGSARPGRPTWPDFSLWIATGLGLAIGVGPLGAATSADNQATSTVTTAQAPLKTPRDFYNAGTRYLQEGKLREAEAWLQTAVASQNPKIQRLALHNLGHVRFRQGLEALRQAPDARTTAARGQQACALADRAIRLADEALQRDELEALVAAYINGRGARKQLREAAEAVKRALEEHGAVLTRWQRASGDFKSAHELGPDPDAQHNAELVDREIAKLVDQQLALQFAMQACSQKKDGLRAKLGELKKRIPEELLKKCQNGEEDDEEDEEEQPKEPKPGQQEPKPREGRERLMSPEEALRLLDSLKVDAYRKLPMGWEEPANPKDRDRTGRDW